MKTSNEKSYIFKVVLFLFLSFILIYIDQVTKKIAFFKLYNKEPYVIINNILEFVYTENRGAAFGILQNMKILFVPLTIVVLVGIMYLLHKMVLNKHYTAYFITLLLIFSGAIGNFIDRIKNSYVIDFIYFKPIDFPVFNLADTYITIGCILLIISILTIYRKDNLF